MNLENNLKNLLEKYLGQYLNIYLGDSLRKYFKFINDYPAISTFIIVVVVITIFILTYLFFLSKKRIFKKVKIKGRLFAAFFSIILALLISLISLSVLFTSRIADKQLSSLIWMLTLLPLAISIFFSIFYVFSIAGSFHKYIERLKLKISEKAD